MKQHIFPAFFCILSLLLSTFYASAQSRIELTPGGDARHAVFELNKYASPSDRSLSGVGRMDMEFLLEQRDGHCELVVKMRTQLDEAGHYLFAFEEYTLRGLLPSLSRPLTHDFRTLPADISRFWQTNIARDIQLTGPQSPNAEYHFFQRGWTGDNGDVYSDLYFRVESPLCEGGSASLSFQFYYGDRSDRVTHELQPLEVELVFIEPQYQVSIRTHPPGLSGQAQAAGQGSYRAGQNVVVSVAGIEGYDFNRWFAEPALPGIDPYNRELSFTMPARDVAFTAEYTVIPLGRETEVALPEQEIEPEPAPESEPLPVPVPVPISVHETEPEPDPYPEVVVVPDPRASTGEDCETFLQRKRVEFESMLGQSVGLDSRLFASRAEFQRLESMAAHARPSNAIFSFQDDARALQTEISTLARQLRGLDDSLAEDAGECNVRPLSDNLRPLINTLNNNANALQTMISEAEGWFDPSDRFEVARINEDFAPRFEALRNQAWMLRTQLVQFQSDFLKKSNSLLYFENHRSLFLERLDTMAAKRGQLGEQLEKLNRDGLQAFRDAYPGDRLSEPLWNEAIAANRNDIEDALGTIDSQKVRRRDEVELSKTRNPVMLGVFVLILAGVLGFGVIVYLKAYRRRRQQEKALAEKKAAGKAASKENADDKTPGDKAAEEKEEVKEKNQGDGKESPKEEKDNKNNNDKGSGSTGLPDNRIKV